MLCGIGGGIRRLFYPCTHGTVGDEGLHVSDYGRPQKVIPEEMEGWDQGGRRECRLTFVALADTDEVVCAAEVQVHQDAGFVKECEYGVKKKQGIPFPGQNLI